MIQEWAIVPITGMPKSRPARAFDVLSAPPMKLEREAETAPSGPWALRRPNPRGLCGDEAPEVEPIEHEALDDLGLDDVGVHAGDRGLGEDDLALAHRVDVSAEAEFG
jgi:hypothetical protein